MIKKTGQPYKSTGHKAPKGPGLNRPKLKKGGKGSLSDFKNKPKPTQYPKGHPLSPTLEQDKWDTLNDFHNSVPNRLDAFEEADPVLPDPKTDTWRGGVVKPKFGLFESPW